MTTSERPGKSTTNESGSKKALRQRAEAILQTSRSEVAKMQTGEIQELVHELQVHQIELKLQNEELRQTQHELADSLDRFSDLYEFAPVGYFTVDSNGVVRQANLTASKILDVDRNSIVNHPLTKFIARQSQDAWHLHRQEIYAGSPKSICELDLLKPDNSPCTVRLESVASPQPEDSDGHQIRCAMVDVTQEKEARDWIIQAKRLQSMVENLPAGAVFIEHEQIQLNRAAEQITGYSRHELATIDQWFAKLYGERQKEVFRQYHADRRAGFSNPTHVKMTRKNGEQRLVDIARHGFDDHEVWILHDVTQRQLAQNALIESEAKFQMLADHVPEQFAYVDADLRFRYVNNQYEERFGLSQEEIVGRHVSEILVATEFESLREHIPSVLSGQSIRFESRVEPGNPPRWVSVKLEPHKSGDRVDGFFALITDISERKETERILRVQERAIQSAENGILITDATSPDNPIVFCNAATELMTGYSESEIVGRNCRFLQGDDRDQPELNELRKAISEGRSCNVVLRNYRKDGSLFWNELTVSPIHDGEGDLTHFVGIQNDITNRRAVETALQNEKSLLETIVESVPDALLLASLDRKITFCNSATERVFGYRSDELRGKAASILYANIGDHQRMGRVRFNANATDQIEPAELDFLRKSGERFVGEIKSAVVRHTDGHALGFLGLVRDVSQRKQLEKRLRRLSRVFVDATVAIWIKDVTGQIVDANPVAVEQYGWSREELIGEPISVLVPPELQQDHTELMQKCLRGKPVRQVESTMVTKMGCPLPVRLTLSLLTDESGQAIGLATLAEDITELKSAEAELRTSEERLRLALRATNEAIWDFNVAEGTVWFNAAYREQFGRPKGASSADWWAQRIHPADRSRILESLSAFSDGAGDSDRWTNEYRFQRADGSYAHVVDRALRAVDQSGKTVRVVGSLWDMTERRALEKEVLDIANEENRRIGNDLHDGIGQELTGLTLVSDALVAALRRLKLPQLKLAENLDEGITRTLGHVRALARGMNPVEIDGEGLMSALIEMSQRITSLYGVDCRLNDNKPVLIRDNQTANQLYRIAQEATTNAIKHGKAKTIKIEFATANGKIAMRIEDDGIGIGNVPEQQAGMGLRIMSYRAGLIHGQLKIKPLEQGGTEVECLLPCEVLL